MNTGNTLARLQALSIAGPTEAAPKFEHCSCGCVTAHKIARRETADSKSVEVWSDGTLTQQGVYLRGLGEPRSAYGARTRARAVRAIADDLSLYTTAEIPTVVKIAERTFAHTWSSETDRRATIRVHAARALEARS